MSEHKCQPVICSCGKSNVGNWCFLFGLAVGFLEVAWYLQPGRTAWRLPALAALVFGAFAVLGCVITLTEEEQRHDLEMKAERDLVASMNRTARRASIP